MSVNNKKVLNTLVRAGARYAAEQKSTARENGTAKKSEPLSVGAVATVLGGLMLVLTGQAFALPLLIAGLVSLSFGAAAKQRKKTPRGDAHQQEIVPQTSAAAKKLAEQKQFLDSGLIDEDEYRENCAKIRARERAL